MAMTNNDILRNLRYTFDFKDSEMISIFDLGGKIVSREEISNWMKREEDPDYIGICDLELAIYLNGFINLKRGAKEEGSPAPEKKLTNNMILKKLKIALDMKDEDILDVLMNVNFKFSKHELSAFFRNPSQSQYRPCKDQILRNFLQGIQLKYRKI